MLAGNTERINNTNKEKILTKKIYFVVYHCLFIINATREILLEDEIFSE